MGALFLFSHGPGWARASDVAGAAGAAGAARLAQLVAWFGLSASLLGLGAARLQPTGVLGAQGLGKVLLLGPPAKVRPEEQDSRGERSVVTARSRCRG